jgi:LAO/AO transport system kinase
MADTTLLVLVPESGDGIQTLKSGIMEIADVFVVNKADRSGADKLRQEIEVTLGIRRGNAFRNMPAHHGVKGSGAAEPAPSNRARGQRGAPKSNDDGKWENPVLLASAAKGEGIPEIVAALDQHHDYLERSGELGRRRRRRLSDRTHEVVDRATRKWIWEETRAEQLIDERLNQVVTGELSPYEVAAEVLDGLKQGART